MTLKIKAEQKTTPYSCNLLTCGGDDDDCWLIVITAPLAHMSLLSQQMMSHLCLTGATGIAGAFLTLRTQEEPITRQATGSMLSNRGSPVWLAVRYGATVVLLQT